jgi:dTDP-4-dehydrorhamnose reductase
MKKILVLESGTMLGHVLHKYLLKTNKYTIITTSSCVKLDSKSFFLDVTDKNSVDQLIYSEKPDIVINCAGVLIEGSNQDPANAVYQNSFLPHQLSKILRETGGKLIHISTDCVFSGRKGGYAESDFRDADDIYGRSKALGEINNKIDLTIRTSKIGPELGKGGEELLHWFLNQKGTIKGYTDAFWSGVTTLELSKGIEAAIEEDIRGLANFTNGIPISKYDLLMLIREIWGRDDIFIRKSDDVKKDRTLLNSVVFSYQIPSYREMVTELKKYMDNNRGLYTYKV